jgi:transcriptional regulator with XRE-family HTH domain
MVERLPRTRPLLRTMLGDVLRRTRLEQGRTLADVAKAARVSMPYLSELERGRKEASSEVLAAICDALEMDLSDLLADVGRELVGTRDRRPAQVIRLGFTSDRQLSAPGTGLAGPATPAGPADGASAQGDVVCLLAA